MTDPPPEDRFKTPRAAIKALALHVVIAQKVPIGLHGGRKLGKSRAKVRDNSGETRRENHEENPKAFPVKSSAGNSVENLVGNSVESPVENRLDAPEGSLMENQAENPGKDLANKAVTINGAAAPGGGRRMATNPQAPA